MAALSSLYAATVFRNDPHLLSLQYKLKMTSLSTEWIENEHFRLVSMKISIFKSKTGTLHSGTGKSRPNGSFSSNQPARLPCWVVSLAFGLISMMLVQNTPDRLFPS
jgi:hypothetical protein